MRFALIFFLFHLINGVQGQIITTCAGNGTYGYSGNGGPATAAQLAWPYAVAADNSGNIYIGDHDNNVIRKVNSAGIITTFAGTGALGYSGDGGLATSAKLYHPGVITLDNVGNIYFADQNSEIIRKITPAGIITSISGTLPPGYSGDGGPLMLAQFRSISGLTFDNSGNLYIADFSNFVIRKVNTSGIITTIAGNGIEGFGGDGGPATAAMLDAPYGVVIRSDGNVFIPDARNNRIRVVNTAGIINTYAGTGVIGYSGDGGPASNAKFNWPWHSTIDAAGNIYVVDAYNEVVRKIDNNGMISTVAGNGTGGYSGDGGPATSAQMTDECGIACDQTNNIYVVNRTPVYVVRKISICLNATITQQPSNVTLCNSGNTMFSILASNVTTYQWQLNSGAGWGDLADNSTYGGCQSVTLSISNANPVMNGYQYRCVTANGCGSVYSIAATLSVIATVTPSVVITIPSSNICSGNTTTFTANAVNGGTTPAYQWQKNGSPVGSNSNTYTDNALNNGDVINCTLTSNAPCLLTPSANSNNITMTVLPVVAASVAILASSTTICAGSMASFSAAANNGGSTPTYQWQVNGINVGTNSPLYNSTSLLDGDFVKVIMTSSVPCASPSTVTSNQIRITVTQPAQPVVTIINSDNFICPGTSVTFTAVMFNQGASPSFQWQVNGVTTGPNAGIFTTSSLANGDVVRVIMTSNLSCISPQTATSNAIPITVNNFTTASVVLSTVTTTICAGTNTVFTAIPTNGGTAPVYQWQINGIHVGSNSSTFNTISLVNGDIVKVIMTTNLACASPAVTTSNPIVISVSPSVPASISITSSSPDHCAGTLINFTSQQINGGATPDYQWQVNGINAGGNSPNYSSSSLANGDVVTVSMISSLGCAIPTPAISAPIIISTLPILPVSVSIQASSVAICSGSSALFTANPVNEGASPIFQWQINGINTGTNSPLFNSSTLGNGDRISLIMTSSAFCPSPVMAMSNVIQITVTEVVEPSLIIGASPPEICPGNPVTFTASSLNGGNSPTYQWSLNGSIVGTNNYNYLVDSLKNGDVVSCTMVSNHICASPAQVNSNSISIVIDENKCPNGFFIPGGFTPNQDGKNDTFKPLVFGNVMKYEFSIYNRWGQLLFKSIDVQKGWDGKLSGWDQDSNVFIWMCTYQFEGLKLENKKGTFVLIR